MAFGRCGREVELPDRNVAAVLGMRSLSSLDDPVRVVAEALERPIDSPPLHDLARGRRDAVVVVCDRTRPAPNRTVLPPILRTLEQSGIARERITLLIATGMHPPNEGDDLLDMLGEEITGGYRVVNHRATRTEEQVPVGTTADGIAAAIDAVYARASLKITTGFIEPHLMAGFSGGRKLGGIGCGSAGTIARLHAPRIIEDPHCMEGCLAGNPLHEALTEIASLAGMDFTVNVTMDEQRRVTGVFAGHFDRSFLAGCQYAADCLTSTVDREADIVVTSGGGYPQDISYYHTGKAFCGARHVCKPGGTIIALSECSRGLGKPEYVELCRELRSVDDFLDRFVRAGPEVFACAQRIDQWQIHNLTRALRKCECRLVDGGLTPEQRGCLLHPAGDSFEEALSAALARHGLDARIAVIPAGPNVLAGVG